MAWKMSLCPSDDQPLREKTFETWQEALDWLSRNHPVLVRPQTWSTTEGTNFRQFGTGYYWAAFSRF